MNHRLRETPVRILFLSVVLALLAGSITDRGADQSLRLTLFPLALTCFDPLLWTCVWGSLLVAALAAACSLILGVAIAISTQSRSYWGRPILVVLTILPLAIPPAISAGAWRVSNLFTPWIITDLGGGLVDLTPWLIWLMAASIWGSALVAASASSRLARIDNDSVELARSLGLGPWTRWRELVWPTIRPATAQAASMVFSLVIFDPGPPIVLGLKRTLAWETLASMQRVGGLPRVATISLGMILVCTIVHLIVFRPGCDQVLLNKRARRKPHRSLRAIFALPLMIVISMWSILSLTAIALLCDRVIHIGWRAQELIDMLRFGLTQRIVFGTVIGLVSVIATSRLLGRTHGKIPPVRRPMIPPLAIGVAVVLLSQFVGDLFGLVQSTRLPTEWTAWLSRFSPDLGTTFFLVLTVALASIPWLSSRSATRTRPFAYPILVASIGVTWAAPTIALLDFTKLTTLGADLCLTSNDPGWFCLLSLLAMGLNVIPLGACALDRRSHLGDWIV